MPPAFLFYIKIFTLQNLSVNGAKSPTDADRLEVLLHIYISMHSFLENAQCEFAKVAVMAKSCVPQKESIAATNPYCRSNNEVESAGRDQVS